jgi:hypothetical protein
MIFFLICNESQCCSIANAKLHPKPRWVGDAGDAEAKIIPERMTRIGKVKFVGMSIKRDSSLSTRASAIFGRFPFNEFLAFLHLRQNFACCYHRFYLPIELSF